jgi:hypothetical protein
MRPYKDLEVTDKYIIREFDENIDPIELIWHRELPTSLNKPIHIPKHKWHRAIKGSGKFKLKIYLV